MTSYETFIATKGAASAFPGITVQDSDLTVAAFPHQRALTRWALRRGRAAIFADTGLGKTFIELEWARHVAKHGRVLILAPLAVGRQTEREARTWGLECVYRREDDGSRVTVTNYEMLGHFDPADFAGIVLDESSILKAYDGATRTAIIEAFRETPYRLAATATPAPNDHGELGNHAEFLGVKTRTEMLAEFFVHDGETTQEWRLKGHAALPFWRWVATWGAFVRMPSDLGFDDSRYRLPPLRTHEHRLEVGLDDAHRAGFLFPPTETTLSDQRRVRRATLDQRIEKAAELVRGKDPAIVWCESNAEGDALEQAIPDAIQVTGSQDVETKAALLERFATGGARVLVTKAKIAGHGLNWQHCANVVFVGASHSYEQTYQAIRRCWRFGQTRPVDVHWLVTAGEGAVVANLRRKEADAERMMAQMTAHVIDAVRAEVGGATRREWNPYEAAAGMVVPEWIGEEECA